jgi:hypothetical protein
VWPDDRLAVSAVSGTIRHRSLRKKHLAVAAQLQSFFRSVAAIFRPSSVSASYREQHAVFMATGAGLRVGSLMFDIGALAVIVASFACLFALVWALGRL